MRTLIVGAGQAAVQVAASLREFGYAEPVTLVGAEPHSPYQRPPLSKELARGHIDVGSLSLRADDWFIARDLQIVTGEHIAYVDLDRQLALAVSGRSFTFDNLVLATGCRSRRLTVPGAEARRVHYLRSASDAVSLQHGLANANKISIIGAGYIGLEVAASCIEMGMHVEVIDTAHRLLEHAVSETVSDHLQRIHLGRGVSFHLGQGVRRIAVDEVGNVDAVVLENGEWIAADLVVVGVGASPSSELALHLGLEVDGGFIVTDGRGRTSDPRVHAAGDCAIRAQQADGHRHRITSVQNAVAQAKAVAADLAGLPSSPAEVPWFWSTQYDVKLQLAGLRTGGEDIEARLSEDPTRFHVVYTRDGVPVAGEFINQPAQFLSFRRALESSLAAAGGPR